MTVRARDVRDLLGHSRMLARRRLPRLRERLPGRKAEFFRMVPAVVLGQDLAQVAGLVCDGALADLAARHRQLGDGYREAAGS